jgi:CRP/FNR family cyclic AMP-dependent transcriptional regulator
VTAVRQKETPISNLRGLLIHREIACQPVDYAKKQVIFAQGDPADAVFCIERGRVKLTVDSRNGREAVLGILGPGEFFGEACLAGQSHRVSTAAGLSACSVVRIAKPLMARLLREEPAFSERFLVSVLARKIRVEEDLVDQLFNSSEKRLARLLLLLANFGKEEEAPVVIPRMSQETLAEMVGTTRSRVSFFMNRFRRMGYIDYDGDITVHNSLLKVVLSNPDGAGHHGRTRRDGSGG